MTTMDLTRFSELLDAYGADPRRWPAAERSAAQDLLAGSAQALELQRKAALLDAALDQYQPAPPAPALRQRLLGAVPLPRPGWRDALADFWRDLGGWRLAAPAFAASLVLGALLPLWLDETAVDLPDEDLIAAVQLVDELPEWNP